ncbi:MAG: hypothetical protein RJB26_164 [Pseudomonadota bacterium]|jgi:peroxiredoxin
MREPRRSFWRRVAPWFLAWTGLMLAPALQAGPELAIRPVAASSAPSRPDTPEDWIGYPLPVLSGKALHGPNLRTTEYAGEVVLLAFWASWCGRCEDQLVQLQGLHATYRGAGLAVVGVTLDDSPLEAREFAAAAGVGFPVMHDITKRISRRFALLDLPTLVLVDRAGIVRQVYGHLDRKGRKALLEDIRQLLDE